MQPVKKIFRTYKALIISIAVLLVCGFGFLVGIVPLARKTIDIYNEVHSHAADVEALQQKISMMQTIDEDEMRNKLQTLLSSVPSDKSLSTLLNTLDGLTAQTGVSVDSFSLTKLGSLATDSAKRVTADEQAVGSSILPFTITMTGTFDQMKAFLTAAVSVRRLFRIRTFGVSFVTEKSDTNTTVNTDRVVATVEMDAFYSPIPFAIGSVSQPLTALTSTDNDLIAKVSAMHMLAAGSVSSSSAVPTGSKSDPFSL